MFTPAIARTGYWLPTYDGVFHAEEDVDPITFANISAVASPVKLPGDMPNQFWELESIIRWIEEHHKHPITRVDLAINDIDPILTPTTRMSDYAAAMYTLGLHGWMNELRMLHDVGQLPVAVHRNPDDNETPQAPESERPVYRQDMERLRDQLHAGQDAWRRQRQRQRAMMRPRRPIGEIIYGDYLNAEHPRQFLDEVFLYPRMLEWIAHNRVFVLSLGGVIDKFCALRARMWRHTASLWYDVRLLAVDFARMYAECDLAALIHRLPPMEQLCEQLLARAQGVYNIMAIAQSRRSGRTFIVMNPPPSERIFRDYILPRMDLAARARLRTSYQPSAVILDAIRGVLDAAVGPCIMLDDAQLDDLLIELFDRVDGQYKLFPHVNIGHVYPHDGNDLPEPDDQPPHLQVRDMIEHNVDHIVQERQRRRRLLQGED
jgi:hypothetical protein